MSRQNYDQAILMEKAVLAMIAARPFLKERTAFRAFYTNWKAIGESRSRRSIPADIFKEVNNLLDQLLTLTPYYTWLDTYHRGRIMTILGRTNLILAGISLGSPWEKEEEYRIDDFAMIQIAPLFKNGHYQVTEPRSPIASCSVIFSSYYQTYWFAGAEIMLVDRTGTVLQSGVLSLEESHTFFPLQDGQEVFLRVAY